MESTGIAIGAATFLGLTTAAANVGKAMWEVFRDEDGNLLEEIAVCVDRLKTSTTAIEAAIGTLKREVKEHPHSPVVRQLRKKGYIKGVRRQADALERRFGAMETRITKCRRCFPEFQWVLSIRKKVDGLIPLTTSIATLLQLAFTTIQIDHTQNSLSINQDGAFAKFLMNLLHEKLQIAADKSEEIRRLHDYGLISGDEGPGVHERARSFGKLAKDMCTMADDVRETSNLPQQRRSSSFGSGSRPQPSGSSSRPSRNRLQSPLTTPTSLSSSMARAAAERPPSSSASSVGDMELIELHVSIPKVPTPSRSEAVVPAVDYSPDSWKPREFILSEEADGETYEVLVSPGPNLVGRKVASCRVIYSLEKNLISLSEAQRLDLTIEQTSPRVKKLKNYSQVTRVGLVHGAYLSNVSPEECTVKASFWVCEELDEGIICGSNFAVVQ